MSKNVFLHLYRPSSKGLVFICFFKEFTQKKLTLKFLCWDRGSCVKHLINPESNVWFILRSF